MQRKGGGDPNRLEEGSIIPPVASSSNYQDEELGWRKRVVPPPQRQGWSPVIVLLVGAILLSVCFSAYMYNEASEKNLALHGLATTLQGKSTEFAQKMASSKHRLEELDLGKRKAEEAEKAAQQELQKLHEELTNVKHSLHEEQNKAMRMHRDNVELHKKLKVKSSELKVLEEQTHTFEVEMNQLTKTIHTLQGEVHDDGAGATDYQVLYKKQEEQQQRWKERHAQQQAGVGGGGDAGKAAQEGGGGADASQHAARGKGHKAGAGLRGTHEAGKAASDSAAAAAAAKAASKVDGGGAEGEGVDDSEHEYRDHTEVQ